MNIPDEVIEQAHQHGEGNDADYRFVAEWARREALREAAEEAVGSGSEWIDAWQPNAKMRPIEECIAEDIRALVGGDKTGDS